MMQNPELCHSKLENQNSLVNVQSSNCNKTFEFQNFIIFQVE